MCYEINKILSMIKNKARIKIIGDSIASGTGSSDSVKTKEIILQTKDKVFLKRKGTKSWAALFESYITDKFPETIVINNGCGGITSSEVRDNFMKLYSNKDDIIIILVGANDRKEENGMNKLFENLNYIINFLKENKKNVILMSPNPSTPLDESYPNRLYHMDDVNNIISYVSKKHNVLFVDNFNFIKEYVIRSNTTIEALMTEENCQSDGLHPTDKVYNLMFENLINCLKLNI